MRTSQYDPANRDWSNPRTDHLLAEVSVALLESLDYRETVQRVVDLAVPALADWCAIFVVAEGGELERIEARYREPHKQAIARELQRFPPAIEASAGVGRVLATGEALVVARATADDWRAMARSPEHLAVLLRMNVAAFNLQPLTAHGATIGVLSLAVSGTRRFAEIDLHATAEYAHRAALAVDNAALFSASKRRLDELERAEAALRASEQRLRLALDTAPVTVFMQDAELRYTWVHNPYSHTLHELIGVTDAKLFPPDQAEKLQALKRQVITSGESVRAEIELTTARGYAVFDVTIDPEVDAQGVVTGICGAAFDLTDRRRSEDRLLRLQELTAALSEASTTEEVIAVIVERAGSAAGAQECSVHVLRLDDDVVAWGVSGETAPPEREVPTGVPPRSWFLMEEAARSRASIWIEGPEEWPDGFSGSFPGASAESHQAFAFSPLVIEDRVLGGVGFAFAQPRHFDEAQRAFINSLAQQCAQALERARLFDAELESRASAEAAERKFRGLFEGAVDALLLADADGHCLDANAATSVLLGYSRTELIEMAMPAVILGELWTREGRERLLREGAWHGEHDVRRRDGSLLPVETRARVIETRSGPLIYAALRDIRERREAERLQEDFFANISHDLKNPLSAIKARTQLLRRRTLAGTVEPPAIQEGLSAIDAGIDRLSEQIDELLDVARLRAGQRLELRRMPTDLTALTRQVVREFQPLSGRNQISAILPDTPLIGNWDQARIGRVLANLISNALKFSPEGGPIRIELSRRELGNAAFAEVVVQDQGLGIPASDLPYIFERFRRASNVATNVTGSGVGLAGSLQIVQQHGGSIAVESVEGAGSRFTLRLPM